MSANLVYRKKNSLLINVDSLSSPDTVLHFDFLEPFEEAKVSDGYFRGYDVDDGDMVKATLLNGHFYDNIKQFELSSSSWISGGANMIYNDGDEEFGFTFTTKYIFLGKGKRSWCQPGKFPCNHWSIISLSALESPTSVSVNAYRFGNQPGKDSEVCDVMELGIAHGSNLLLPNVMRVEAWVKISGGWDGNNSHLLQLQLFDANGDSFTSIAGLMKFGLPLKRDAWSLEYYEVNVDGANINDAILHVGSGCFTSGFVFIYGIRLFAKESLIKIQISEFSTFNFEEKSSFRITVQLSDLSGMTITSTVDVKILDSNDKPFFISGSKFLISEGARLGSVVGEIAFGDSDTSSSMGIESLTFKVAHEDPQFLEIGSKVSSEYADDIDVNHIFSEDSTLYWSSTTDPSAIVIDLQKVLEVKSVRINWHGSHSPQNMRIQHSSSSTQSQWEHINSTWFNYNMVCTSGRTDVVNLPNIIAARVLKLSFSEFCTSERFSVALLAGASASSTTRLHFPPLVVPMTIPAGASIIISKIGDDDACHILPTTVTTAQSTSPSATEVLLTTPISQHAANGDACHISFTVVGSLHLERVRVIGSNVFEAGANDLKGHAPILLRQRPSSVSPLSFFTKPQYSLQILVIDGFGLYTEASVTITVVDANERPTVGFNYSFIPPILNNIRYVDEEMPRYSTIGLPIP